ncbi:unnamed protein product [Zymoseptoria tritici ST99CH_3D1]|nr:unnamed protein product [Zymoseptoria tritici ST99CH_3D1]
MVGSGSRESSSVSERPLLFGHTSGSRPSSPVYNEKQSTAQSSSFWKQASYAASKTSARAISRIVRGLAKSITKCLTPSAPAETSRTASYDGLRGVACLVVFNFHFLYPYTHTITYGYGGVNEDVATRFPHQLPFLCLLVRGRAMVTLFFAISGFVLSHGFLGAVRSGRLTDAVSRLSSLAIRRWLRLFAPAFISMMLVCLSSYVGAFDRGYEFQEGEWLTGMWEEHPPRYTTLRMQLLDFWAEWWAWSSPFRWSFYFGYYDPHTWTIPVEFRGSMVLFLVLLATAGLKPRWSFGIMFLVTGYCLSRELWEVATFTGGALVAHLHQATAARRSSRQLLPNQSVSTSTSVGSSQADALFGLHIVAFLFSLFLLSFPDDGAGETPGFRWLESIAPLNYASAREFWQPFGAVFILYSVEHLHSLRTALSSPLPQYLGKISFAFYLVHGPLLHSAGMALQPTLWTYIGGGSEELSDAHWLGGLFIGWMTMLTLSIAVGHLFWLMVDLPLVRATRWLELKARK